MVDRTRKEFSDADIEKITRAYHAWRGETDAGTYEDVPGFCKSASLDEIKEHNYVLTPGRYVGAADVDEDVSGFEDQFAKLQRQLDDQFSEAERLGASIRSLLKRVAT